MMLFDIMRIGFLDPEQVVIWDILFVGAVAFFYILLQAADGRVEVYNNIGLNQLLMDNIKQALVQTEFVFGQVDLGKEQTLGKEVI
jgi:hypothetical protein